MSNRRVLYHVYSVNPISRRFYLEYTEIGGDEELPLGQEFQEHLKCFIDPKGSGPERYALAGKLVQQLS